ncbi:MAG: hypothetical protein Q8912_11445 [Bacillota bacterium]|nr:hypothetical protein [Bacillota bacterium]
MNPPYEYRNILWKESSAGESGRVLVNMEGIRKSRLDVYNYEGSKLSAYHIYAVLKVALTMGWAEALENLHLNRKNKWKAEMFVSPEGEKEYRLYTTTEHHDPVCSSVIAISKSQIHTFSILSEDAPPLLKKIIEDYPPVFLPRCRNDRYAHCFPSFYYLDTLTMKFLMLPEPLQEQRERTQRITVGKDMFLSGIFQAGETSGLIETIEALKCLEVLQA